MPQSPGREKQTPPSPATREQQQDCAWGPDSWAGGPFPLAPGVSVLHLHPPQGQPSTSDGQGHPQRVTALPWCTTWHRAALHPPLHPWSGIMCVVCLVLAGFHPKGLPQEVFPWHWGGWKGRESRQVLSRLPALGFCWWRIVTSTSTDAVCSSHILQGKMLGGCCC